MRHLLGLRGVSRAAIEGILDDAAAFKREWLGGRRRWDALHGRTVVTMFFENSTRTRLSFEAAARRMGAMTLGFTAAGSSVSKGESLVDTAYTLEAMQPDVMVVRHNAEGAPALLARIMKPAVINAGDGAHEHPTQALLDAMTIRERLGVIDGLRVAIIGDVAHSRVARSNILCLQALGASVVCCGPATLLPPDFGREFAIETTTDINAALDGADVAMALRIQLERQERGFFPSIAEYVARYGLTLERIALRRVRLVMHPGPMNRDVEVSGDLADSPECAARDQVENGVYVRMAVLGRLEL